MDKVIGADHEFHDAGFASGWAERFQPTPDRLRLFDLILTELQARVGPDGLVMELGMGPGYLAAHLLSSMPRLRYCGVDFSRAMLDIAAQRLGQHAPRVDYRQADLVSASWWAEQAPSRAPSSPRGRCTTWVVRPTSKRSTPVARRSSAATAFCLTAISLNRLVPRRTMRLVGSR